MPLGSIVDLEAAQLEKVLVSCILTTEGNGGGRMHRAPHLFLKLRQFGE